MGIDSIIQQARKAGIADETKIRNLTIKEEFKQMRRAGQKYEDVIVLLADKFYLSDSRIRAIVRSA